MIPANDININLNSEIKVGDTTLFKVDGKMVPVEVIRLNHDNTLKIMSCDMKYIWDNISHSKWLKQVEFLKQID